MKIINVNNNIVDSQNLLQNYTNFYFLIMKNDQLSHSLDFSELLYHKKQKKNNSLIFCQGPCRQEIAQNQKILQLQSDYIKSLQLQNLRRNQERIYLEAEIKQLRLQLDQPKKEKEQLVQKIRYYKGQYERAQHTYKQLQIYTRNQQKQLMLKADEINNLKSNNEKVQLQTKMTQQHAKDLQEKLNKLYNQIDGRLPRERKNSMLIKQQYNSSQLVQSINKKWEQYCEEIKFKIHSENMKEIQKLAKEIMILKNEKTILQKKVQQLIKQVKNQKNQKNELERCYKSLQDDYRTIEEDYNSKIAGYIQSNRLKLQQKIKDLQNQLFQQQMCQIKHSFNSQQIKLNTTSSIEDIEKLQTQLLFQNANTQNKEVQTTPLIQLQTQNAQLSFQKGKLQQTIRQKDIQIEKLKQKLETMNKINQMIKSKTIQNQKSINRAQSIQLMGKKQTAKEQSESVNSIFTFLLGQYSSNAEIADTNIKKLQQIIKQKDNQIQSLQNANKLLKDMKITALQNSNKILQLQKQNHKLKRQLHQAKQGLIKSRGGSNKSNTSVEQANNHLTLKKPSIPINSKTNLYRSFVQSKQDHLYRSQYQNNQSKTQLKTKTHQFQHPSEQEKQIVLTLNQKLQNNNLTRSQIQNQELPVIKMKITRVQSRQKLVKE